MLKNLSKNLSIYLLILATAAAGFALIALSSSTTALATTHDDDEVVITGDNCWKYAELGGAIPGDVGNTPCRVFLQNFQPYLDYKLPPIDETYDTRENYIQRLYDDMIAVCNARRAGNSLTACHNPISRIKLGYLYEGLPISGSDSALTNGQESELLILLWADIKVNEWGNQERYEQDNLPPTAGSYYVYRPTIEPQPPQADREPPQRSPARPPASLPSESSFEDTHEDNQQGWDDSQADQYRYDGDGYYRRKKQGDGTFKCYFNGYDGSLANLGEC